MWANLKNISMYESKFSDSKFWKKLFKALKLTGVGIIEKALTLYYTSKDEATPKWAKSIVYGTLGYFIFPIDAVPDIIPIAGYSDDLTVIVAAFGTLVLYIKDEHKLMARKKVENIMK